MKPGRRSVSQLGLIFLWTRIAYLLRRWLVRAIPNPSEYVFSDKLGSAKKFGVRTPHWPKAVTGKVEEGGDEVVEVAAVDVIGRIWWRWRW